jgi:hypothetical protein
VRRKRLGAAFLPRHLVFPSPETLFIWIRHHFLVFNLLTRSPLPVFLLREIPKVLPFPVYLLREAPDMKEWLLPAALGVHFRLLLYSLRRVRKAEVTPRFHFRFADPKPDMESLLLPLGEVPYFNRLLTRVTLISGKRSWSRLARDLPPMRVDSCRILYTRERASPLCLKRIVRMNVNGFLPSPTYPFPVSPFQFLDVRQYRNRK